MKKHLLVILFSFSWYGFAYTQCLNDTYTGFGGGNNDQGQNIVMDSNQNVYICGYFHDSLQVGNTILTSDSIGQFLCKISSMGTVQWAKVLYNSSITYYSPPVLKINHANELIVAGACQEVNGNFDTIINAFTNGDLFIARFNASTGSLNSFLSTGRHLYTFINDFDIDLSDNIYLAGIFVGVINLGGISMNCLGQTNSFIAKFDSQNQCTWAHRITTTPNTTANSPGAIGFDLFNHLYLSGWYGLNADFGNGISLNSPVYSNGFIAKYDLNGNVIWAKTSDTSRIYNFQMINDTGSITIVETNPVAFINYNQNGDTSWTRQISGTGNLFSKFIYKNGNYYATGNFYNSFSIDGNIYSSPGFNSFTSSFNMNGSISWVKIIQSTGGIQCSDFAMAPNQDFAVTGLYNPMDTLDNIHVMPWWGGSDVLFIKLCDVGAGFENDFRENNQVTVYPNPAQTVIRFNNLKNEKINIFNIFGAAIFEKTITSKNEMMEIDISFLVPGIYFLKTGSNVMKFIKE